MITKIALMVLASVKKWIEVRIQNSEVRHQMSEIKKADDAAILEAYKIYGAL